MLYQMVVVSTAGEPLVLLGTVSAAFWLHACELDGWLQVIYLTTDSPTVTLKRRRSGSSAGAPPSFSASATLPFVPAFADALARWKHYLFRAFAGRHLLALTAAGGTPAEHTALGDFHSQLRGLLPRVCRSGGLGGAPVPMSDEDALLIEEINRSMQYAPCCVLCAVRGCIVPHCSLRCLIWFEAVSVGVCS